MKKQILSILLLCCMVLTLLPTYAAATETENTEQFNLKPADEYYYFYIEEWGSYVRFNYAGTVDAYVLNSRSRGKTGAAEEASENTQNTGTWFGHTYTHSLFIARNTYLKGTSWDALNGQGLIFGKTYESNGVKYTMRAPTVGSNYRELEEGWKVTPANNEWDAMLNKGTNIRNADYYSSWGQDTTEYDNSYRAVRGGKTKENRGAQIWGMYESDETKAAGLYYRPVLEVMNAEELGKDGLKVVTLDMNWGNLLPSSVQRPKIIVRGGTATFKAPTATGIKRPRGNTGSYFKWLGDDGALYEPGAEVPATVTELKAQWNVPEQFSLEPGETYYFDLSKKGLYTANQIRTGKVYKNLPDKTLHYVPFTYAGTVDAYVLNGNAEDVATAAAEASATTDPNAQYGYTFKHSLFIADYILKNKVSWKELNKKGWIFGKNYKSGNISYTMRAPTVGSNYRALEEGRKVTPANNEWDAIADKSGGYIKNWVDVCAWGQDSAGENRRNKALRGLRELRRWGNRSQGNSSVVYGYRPVLEVKNAADLGRETLKVVTLQLEEANVGDKNSIKIIVRSGQTFTAPSCEGLTVAEGYDRASFRWKDSDGNLYAPGGSVPATVTELKAQWGVTEQFSLEPGGTYYFDLSAVGGSHYQAFTYAGTVGAYRTVKDSENKEHSGNDPHTLFVSESITRWGVSWHTLNGEGLIFGKTYESNGVGYAMRAPTGGNGARGNNEWDRILDKNETYIKGSFGRGNWCQEQDRLLNTLRGADGNGVRAFREGMGSHIFYNYRPVLEVMNAKALGQDSLKAVTLQLNGGTVDGKTQIQIIVKNGETFTAPVLDGIGKPGDYTEGYFQWLGNDGQLYAPGDSVPATVDTLMAQFAPAITTDTLPGGKVDEAYRQTLTANGTTPIIWSIENGGLPAGLSLNKDTGEISGTPTADGTAKFTVKAENRVGSDMKELSITIDKAEPPSHAHSYSDWIADGETGHYRICTDEYCTSADKGRAAEAHLYDDDADTICDVCGYERTVTPPTHEHSYGDWIKDGTSHWHECTDDGCPEKPESVKDKAAHVYTDDADSTCDVCGYERTVTPPVHEHTYSDWIADGETGHYRVCTDEYCTSADKGWVTEAHIYDDDADTICNACGYERTVTPPVHEHTYSNWSKDDTNHWHECTDDGCPEKPESVKNKAAHVYTDDTDTTCDVCGYKRTITPPVHEHTYGDWSKDDTNHWRECTDDGCPERDESITDKAAHVYTDDADMTCDVCGYERTITPPSHEHNYSNWSRDDTSHWHECTDADCPDRNESIKDKAAHIYTVYTDDADTTATEFSDGSDVAAAYVCDVCGYERIVTPPSHEHSYDNWSKDGTSHWHECTDDGCPEKPESVKDKAAHTYTDDADTTCDVCGYERTVTPPVHEHTYSDWTADGETGHYRVCTDEYCTSADKGRVTETHLYDDDADMICNACGYERTATPPSHEHSYGDWSKDDTNHWHECTDNSCPDRDESIKDKAAHVYSVYTDNAAATCNVCGYEHTGTPTVHEHTYSDWTADGETGHYRICTDEYCTSADKGRVAEVHLYDDDADMICNACGYDRTVTPPSHEHNYSNWSRDDTSHWHECTDADCPDRNESIKDKAAHIYTVYTDDADTTATEFSDGSDVAAAYVCDVCGYERIVTPPSHEHSYDNWSKDGTSHWHECTDADCPDKDESIKDKAAHVYTVYTDNAAATCNICGYEHTGTPPVHEHSYSDWTADGETGHYRVCTDENCTSADKGRVTEAHVYTDDADTTAAEFSDGSDVAVAHIYTDDADMICHVCGYKRTGTPPAPTEFTITSDSNGGYNPPATP